jgi:hypothetical protein
MTLTEYIKEAKQAPFQWGSSDCYTFVRGWIDLQFPDNKLPIHDYRDLKGAYKWNQSKQWVEEIKKAFDYELVDAKNVQDGDILIIKDSFQCAHLINQSMAYSVDIRLGVVGVSLKMFAECSFLRLRRAY